MKELNKISIAKPLATLFTAGLLIASQATVAEGSSAAGANASPTTGVETNTTGNASRGGNMGAGASDANSANMSGADTNRGDSISSTNMQNNDAGFGDIDADGDERLGWSEINETHEQELGDAGWDQEQVFSEFDEDGDSYLNEEEYQAFTSGLNDEQNRSASVLDE